MNREIEFRGKRIDNEEWVYGHYVRQKEKHFIMHGADNVVATSLRVFPETVGQYIGLIDADGKKIYEGDIIKVNHFNEDFIVAFEYGSFGFGTKGIDRNTFDQFYHSDYCKVIGTIHDNKLKER